MSAGATRLAHRNLAAVHEAVSEAVPARDCIVFRDRRLTFDDVTRRTRQLAHVLRNHGFGAQSDSRDGFAGHESHTDHLAILAYNGNEYLEAMLGAFKARMSPVNVNYRYRRDEMIHVLADSAAVAIVYHSEFAPNLAEALPSLPRLRTLLQIADESDNELLPGAQWYEEALSDAPGQLPEWASTWSPDDLYIVYTGGTTGNPKGVLWRHDDIYLTAMGGRSPITREPWPSLASIADAVRPEAPQIACAAAPFMHGAGHWTAFMSMNLGSTVVIPNVVARFDADDLCRVIEREGITYLQIVGDAFGRPIVDAVANGDYDLSSLRVLLSGGTALTTSVKQALLSLVPQLSIIESLGSSEGGGQGLQVTTATSAEPTAGRFAPTEGSVVISAERDRVLPVSSSEVGWVAKAGGHIPLGYLGDAAKTAATFPVVAGERMSVPGDRAAWNADGTIQLLGRESVTINSGGEKIFAEEVESAIASHPDVRDALVTSRPSQRWGQEVVAVVQLSTGTVCDSIALAAHSASRIARYKLPKAWIFVDVIERSAAGKANYRWAADLAQRSAG